MSAYLLSLLGISSCRLSKETEWVVRINESALYSIKISYSELSNTKILKLNEQVLFKKKL